MKLAALLVLVANVAQADVPRECSKEAMRKTRNAADKAMRAGNVKDAIALLAPLVSVCDDIADKIESAWLAGDLAVAYRKDGQPLECEKLMAPWTHPSSGLEEGDNDKLVSAIQYNLDQCAKDFDAPYAAIKADACPLAIDDAVASAAAPIAKAPRGASVACVALVSPAEVAIGGGPACPDVALVWKKGAKVSRNILRGDATHDESFCCNLNAIAIGVVGGKTLVRVKGEGRECSGGTADVASDYILEWKGKTLTTVLDASVGYH